MSEQVVVVPGASGTMAALRECGRPQLWRSVR